MRLGQESRKKTPICASAVFVGVVALAIPDAAFVGAQDAADLPIEKVKEAIEERCLFGLDQHHERHQRVSVLGRLTSGGPARAIAPPTDAEVMHALECVRRQRNSPGFDKSDREGVRIIKEKIADYVDPLRFYPLIGTAHLHHAHYKCTIYLTERTGKDLPYEADGRDAVEVLSIDHNHFHMPSNPKTGGRALSMFVRSSSLTEFSGDGRVGARIRLR